jgi:predicted RNA methylase
MNAKSVSSAVKAAVSADASSPQAGADAIVAAANLLLADLARGVAIDARALRAAMIASFGASDAEGAWDWKAAYEACEAAQILFLRKFGPAMRDRAASPLRFLAMVTKLAALVPSYTWRSEESRASQQFSTPIALGFVARTAAAITPADLVPEPSAGTGLLAIHAELAGARLVLNEIADSRAGLLERLFPGAGVTRYDADHIHDHLDAGIRPSVVLMNPPFAAAAHADGRVADAALRHISSVLAQLADGGRLVAITSANLSPDNPSWRDGFVRLQERSRVVFSASVDGRVYARHGTFVATCLHVIDRIPADDPAAFPASLGTADDTTTLLDWVIRHVPPRAAPTAAPAIARATLPADAPHIPATNFRITDEVELGKGSEGVKFADNLNAIRILKAIEGENRRATPEEQRALARYVGWGGLSNAFAGTDGEFKPSWEQRGRELADLFTPGATSTTLDGSGRLRGPASPLHLHHLMHRRHVLVQVVHDPERTADEQRDDQHAESERHGIVGIVRGCREVEKKHQVHAHLSNSKGDQCGRDRRSPDQVGVNDGERGCREQHREYKPDDLAKDTRHNN